MNYLLIFSDYGLGLFTDIGDGIAGLELEFLERLLIFLIAVKLYHWQIVMNSQFDENFLPESVKRKFD